MKSSRPNGCPPLMPGLAERTLTVFITAAGSRLLLGAVDAQFHAVGDIAHLLLGDEDDFWGFEGICHGDFLGVSIILEGMMKLSLLSAYRYVQCWRKTPTAADIYISFVHIFVFIHCNYFQSISNFYLCQTEKDIFSIIPFSNLSKNA